ncbi:MAG TPA: hypothetical protein VJS30_08910 [Paraburkholderia sp.]|nr:hypothetical protein [Paraburkholderia sp.]
MKDITQNGAKRRTAWLVCACALVLGFTACRRANEGERPQTTNPVSNQMMGNSAGMSGTPGHSDAAQRAPITAPASGAAQ